MMYMVFAAALALSSVFAYQSFFQSASDTFSDANLNSDAEQFVRIKNIVRAWDSYSRHPDRLRSGSPNGWHREFLEEVQTNSEEDTSWAKQGSSLPPQGSPTWNELTSVTTVDWNEPSIPYGVEINWNNTGWTYVWSEGGARFYPAVLELTDRSSSVCTVNLERDCVLPHYQSVLRSSEDLPIQVSAGSVVYAWRNL